MGAASIALAQSKDAEAATLVANATMAKTLHFEDKSDFEDARRGFIAALPDGFIKGPGDTTAWSMKPYAFLDGDAPQTVNPSLWRQAQLNNIHGLFKVVDRVYQVRGYDISNMTVVEGDTGLIIIDPLLVQETARASLDLYFAHRPKKPVVAVIYTHSHADHFGGVKGALSEDDVKAGKAKIIAPDQFMEYAISENVIAGTAMSRRAGYQFAPLLEKGPKGHVDTGLGRTLARGTFTFIPPNDLIKQNTETRTIDGVEMEFHLTPGAEAPSEMTVYFPQFRVLNMAEVVTKTFHNIYTIRGAEVRDARGWSRSIALSLQRYGEKSDVMIAQHNWPTWGRERIVKTLTLHRDLYKFVHDQTVRLMNHGHTPAEIAEVIKVPESLAREFSARGYYGTVSHNAKAVYQKYLGWYDGNPANLQPLPPVASAKKTIAYMGGADAVIAKAREDFKTGDYRWVASIMREVVYSDPANKAARELGADALEQLGYQAESGTWRNAYLMGAAELRGPMRTAVGGGATPEFLKGVPTDMLFDFLAVRVNADKAKGKRIVINWTFLDTGEKLTLNLENATLTNLPGHDLKNADVSFTLARPVLDLILLKQKSLPMALATGDVKFSGNPLKFGELAGTFDDVSPAFPLIEPKPVATTP